MAETPRTVPPLAAERIRRGPGAHDRQPPAATSHAVVAPPAFASSMAHLSAQVTQMTQTTLPSFDLARFAQALQPLTDLRLPSLHVRIEGLASALERLARAASASTTFPRRTDALDALADAWEEDALWYLLDCLSTGSLLRLDGLTRDEVEQALLDALEVVVREGGLIATLRRIVGAAPYLDRAHRLLLDHGLEHAQRGEWVLAMPNLHPGIEGALRATAVGQALIEAPQRLKKVPPAERLIRAMGVDPNYTRFLIRRVFGGEGNRLRHGHVLADPRPHALMAVVALVGWAETLLSVPAMDALARGLEPPLAEALARARGVATVASG